MAQCTVIILVQKIIIWISVPTKIYISIHKFKKSIVIGIPILNSYRGFKNKYRYLKNTYLYLIVSYQFRSKMCLKIRFVNFFFIRWLSLENSIFIFINLTKLFLHYILRSECFILNLIYINPRYISNLICLFSGPVYTFTHYKSHKKTSIYSLDFYGH